MQVNNIVNENEAKKFISSSAQVRQKAINPTSMSKTIMGETELTTYRVIKEGGWR